MRKRSSLSCSSLEGLVELINLEQIELKGICTEGVWYNPKKDLYECIYSYYVKLSNIKQEDVKSNIQKKVKEITNKPISYSVELPLIPCCDNESFISERESIL